MTKFYACVMFPYPSGNGLHIGHYYNYALMDTYCRWQRYKGHDVFQPFGYDAFGLPAENYAKKIGKDPETVTWDNIATFRKQVERMNTEYTECLVTCEDKYVKWTQWLFTKLHAHGLAYKAYSDVNWCPSCETVLANEQVHSGECERCSSSVETKSMNQWFFKTTAYQQRLMDNLDNIDYPESTKKQQREWIKNLRDWCVSRQRKWGCPIPIAGETDTLDTFVDSSFYFLRYLTDSDSEFLPKEDYKQVDLYVGGPEHACMHLLYARFIHMFLYDIGVVPVEEPFKRVVHQGMITKDGAKMSKSKGNVVNPDDYDPDEIRMYLMFIGHYFDGGVWNDRNIKGIRRFLGRMQRWISSASDDGDDISIEDLENTLDSYITSFKFNKCVSTLMEFYNKNNKTEISIDTANKIKQMLKCFSPGFMNNYTTG